MLTKYILTRRSLHTVWCLSLIVTISITIFDYAKFRKFGGIDSSENQGLDCSNLAAFHDTLVKKYYDKRKNWKTSNLGTIMFKYVDPNMFSSKDDKMYLVMVWKNMDKLLKRHVPDYDSLPSSKLLDNILKDCSVKNCKFTGNINQFYTADAIIMSGGFIPKVSNRNWNQRWIFLSDKSPMKASFLKPPYKRLKDLADIFNWTMTYRSDSDIPIPYGRTLPLQYPNEVFMDDAESALSRIVPFWSEKQFTILATILISNCNVKRRMDYLSELRKYMKVDIYGNCSEEGVNMGSCPENRFQDCKVTKDYLFYLDLESASCRQYLTEKSFHHGYSKGAIPVIMGPPLEDCEKLLPPNSFLHVDNYKTAAELAAHMVKIAENYDELLHLHAWRNHFRVKNEHGYFGTKSSLFCRVCEALNYNDGGAKSYNADDLELFFGKKITCDVEYV